MKNPISIQIKLGNRTYPIKVDEMNVGEVTDRINLMQEKMTALKKQFSGRDELDYVSMTLIDYITSTQKNENLEDHSSEAILQSLEKINQLLDS